MSVRWVYVHMIEEYARHNGHADLLRERIDGATGHSPPAPGSPARGRGPVTKPPGDTDRSSTTADLKIVS